MRRISLCNGVTVALAVLAIGFLFQTLPGKALRIRGTIPAVRLTHEAPGTFQYLLPGWVGNSKGHTDDCTLYENGAPLRSLSPFEWGTAGENGSYIYLGGPPRLIFRASDGSDPLSNDRIYSFKAPLLSPRISLLLGIALAAMAGLIGGHRQLRRLRLDWKWILLVIALTKLWAVAGSEIATVNPDAYGYATSANGMIWWVGDGALPAHTSGFAAIAGIVSQFGVPWRLALELFYLTACALLAGVIAEILSSRTIGCLLFALLAWHPWTFSGFADFMPVPLVLVLIIALLAVMFWVLSRFSDPWRIRTFAGLGLLAFLWSWCRLEDPLIYASYGLFALLAWWLTRSTSHPQSPIRRIVLLALPAMTILILGTGVKVINYIEFGVYAKSWSDAPGLVSLMSALYKVKPEQQIHYAPVTRQSLAAACAVSPSLQRYQDRLMDPHDPQTLVGEKVTKIPGEFGPWLNWLLPADIWLGDVQDNNIVMLRAAAEINEALRSGRLPSRPAFFPLDPNWHLWLPDLLPQTAEALRQGMSMKAWNIDPFVKPEWESVFDAAANRRTPGKLTSEETRLFSKAMRFNTWEQRSEKFYRRLTALAMILTFVIVILKPAWPLEKLRLVFACWALVSSWLLGRALFYGLLNANMGWGTEVYMRPASPLFILILILGAALAGMLLQRGILVIKNHKNETRP